MWWWMSRSALDRICLYAVSISFPKDPSSSRNLPCFHVISLGFNTWYLIQLVQFFTKIRYHINSYNTNTHIPSLSTISTFNKFNPRLFCSEAINFTCSRNLDLPCLPFPSTCPRVYHHVQMLCNLWAFETPRRGAAQIQMMASVKGWEKELSKAIPSPSNLKHHGPYSSRHSHVPNTKDIGHRFIISASHFLGSVA